MARLKRATADFLVVGSGVSGMQAALDMAEMGFRVTLTEKTPSIGGHMAQLDKTFPTNDCSMCILSPRMVACGRNPLISILTLTEVLEVTGKPGRYEVLLRIAPRKVDPRKCLGCGACAKVCPTERDSTFNQGLVKVKAIDRPFPQAYPNAYAIDETACVRCGKCVEACPVKAIDLDAQEEFIRLRVSGIIWSGGYRLGNIDALIQLGYRSDKDVITSLEMERLLSSSGPTGGKLLVPSTGKEPERVAFLQCVGSRDVRFGRPYCSSVCCTYSIKEAILAKEHCGGPVETKIFYMDIRTQGKGFERYYMRAQEEGVAFVRSRVVSVARKDGKLVLTYSPESGGVREEAFDLVVLAVGVVPNTAPSLAATLPAEGPYGFLRQSGEQLLEEPGCVPIGPTACPRDIPESVVSASGGALQVAGHTKLRPTKTPSTSPQFTERDVTGEVPRIGVFVCHCGTNIASVVAVKEVKDYARTLPNVVYAGELLYACSEDSQITIQKMIEKHALNRVIVASCSPRTHAPLFQETIHQKGLNPALFDMANIRDQCSWVHGDTPDQATAKAKELVAMAVAKVRTHRPLTPQILTVTHKALVLGGGVAGMTAALGIARRGFGVTLVEQSDTLGGMARRLPRFWDGRPVAPFLEALTAAVMKNELISVKTATRITDISGYKGHFEVTLQNGQEEKETVGTIILATGAREWRPEGQYGFGQDDRILTQMDLSALLREDPERFKTLRRVVMIQCVGSRTEERPYCSRVCCTQAMQNAMALREAAPEAQIIVTYRDIRTYGLREDLYRAAREKGVLFVRYTPERPPEVKVPEDRDITRPIPVHLYDPILEATFEIPAERVVLAAAMIPQEGNPTIAQMAKVSLDPDGFFLEAHAKLRPVDCAMEGIFLAGTAQGPKDLEESMEQALAAASRACGILAKQALEGESSIAEVDTNRCAGCGLCEMVCPFHAIEIDATKKVSVVNAALCKGCGACVASCRNGALHLPNTDDLQVVEMLKALG